MEGTADKDKVQGIELPEMNGPLIQDSQPPEKKGKHSFQSGKEWIGYLFQMLYVCIQCLNQFFGKILFIRHPELSLT